MISGNLWPVHPQPLPDELLSSWLIRYARGNLQKPYPFVSLTVPELSVWEHDLDASASLRLLLPLSFKSGVAVERLYRATLWPYSGQLYAENRTNSYGRWVLPAGVNRYLRRRCGLQYCPLCLEKGPAYFRRLWRLAFVTLCPEHGTLLRDRCPNCDAPVAPFRVDMGRHTKRDRPSDLPVSACFRCGWDLGAHDSSCLSVADADVRAFQRVLLRVLESGKVTLPDFGEVACKALFDGLRPLIVGLTGARHTERFGSYVAEQVGVDDISFDLEVPNNFEYQPLVNRYHLIRRAAWLLKDWPDRFIDVYARVGLAPSNLLKNRGGDSVWLKDAVAKAQKEKRRRQALKRSDGYRYRELSEQAKTVLHDFINYGAERLDVARKRYPELDELVEAHCLLFTDTPLGKAVVVTKWGRRKLAAPVYRPPKPRIAAGQIMRRRVREKLIAEGWAYHGEEDYNLMSFSSPKNKVHYFLCGYVEHEMAAARHAAKTLMKRLVEEDAVLKVVSREPQKLMGMKAVKEGWVEVIDANIAGDFYQK